MNSSKKKLQKIYNVLVNACAIQQRVANTRFAAMVVYKGDCVALGSNQKKSHPFQAQYAKNCEAIYLHAEIDCIKNALRVITVDQLRKSTMYIVRVKADLTPGLAKPCDGCMRALASFSIKNCYYTTGTNPNDFVCL